MGKSRNWLSTGDIDDGVVKTHRISVGRRGFFVLSQQDRELTGKSGNWLSTSDMDDGVVETHNMTYL